MSVLLRSLLLLHVWNQMLCTPSLLPTIWSSSSSAWNSRCSGSPRASPSASQHTSHPSPVPVSVFSSTPLGLQAFTCAFSSCFPFENSVLFQGLPLMPSVPSTFPGPFNPVSWASTVLTIQPDHDTALVSSSQFPLCSLGSDSLFHQPWLHSDWHVLHTVDNKWVFL